MKTISLRAYNREINQLIENGRSEETIEHCHHILHFYPWHVDTYRLLGTAYLETLHYDEAEDIFLRVLSAIPDDMVAHIGISVIREHKGKIDDAIWHMERAFELQPANRILQDELRRLYGKRDGLEPPRVFLTRGALARMYFKGNLYPQAIAELEAYLPEEKDRYDLQVLLACIYDQAGRQDAAIQLSKYILSKLPNCLEANLILAINALKSGVSSYQNPYLNVIQKLDPYYAFLTPDMLSVNKVSDIAITLEPLDWELTTENTEPTYALDHINEQHFTDIIDDDIFIKPSQVIENPEPEETGSFKNFESEEPPLSLGEESDLNAEEISETQVKDGIDVFPEFLGQETTELLPEQRAVVEPNPDDISTASKLEQETSLNDEEDTKPIRVNKTAEDNDFTFEQDIDPNNVNDSSSWVPEDLSDPKANVSDNS